MGAIALDRDSVGDETGGRRLQLEGMDSRLRLPPHDHIWILRRACCHWRSHTKVDLLVCLHVFLLVHRLRAPRWPCSRNSRRTQPRNRKEDWHSASYDGDQLVHVSYCVFVPNARNFGGKSSGVHPTGLLCVRHYLEMQSWHCHLPDLLCQIQQAVPFAMSMFMIWRAWLSLVFQVVQTLFKFLLLMSCRWLGQQQVTKK